MKRRCLGILLAWPTILFTAALASADVPIINPHKEPPDHCFSCHAAIPAVEDVRIWDYHLLRGTVDETCNICHPYDCCRLYALTGHNHPSNVRTWDQTKFKEPKSLPLFNGVITCNTCHFHRTVDGDTYRMLRMVNTSHQAVDWSDLCDDCHLNY